jgi:hypothetical protein
MQDAPMAAHQAARALLDDRTRPRSELPKRRLDGRDLRQAK